MIENQERIGSFTSSQIHKLIKSGTKGAIFSKAGLTYIKEKSYEIKLGRSIDIETNVGRAGNWGIFMEQYVFKLIGIEYKITSKDTDRHPTIEHWSGSKDLIVPGKKISDIKCYEPKNFVSYIEALKTKNTEIIKELHPKEYWQLVSNAIINSVPNAEAIVFMPYQSELNTIREMAADYNEPDFWKYRFIYESKDSELPYLPNNSSYENLNVFEFKVPDEDKIELTYRVKEAIKILKNMM